MNESLNITEDLLAPRCILCGSCPLGSGAVAESAGRTREHIADCQIPAWSPLVPGGEAIVLGRLWTPAPDCMTTYARCAGCQNGGGPPGLHQGSSGCASMGSRPKT